MLRFAFISVDASFCVRGIIPTLIYTLSMPHPHIIVQEAERVKMAIVEADGIHLIVSIMKHLAFESSVQDAGVKALGPFVASDRCDSQIVCWIQ